MRKTLVIVNYMRVNPTIVDDLVLSFKDKFQKIYVVNRNTNDTYKNISFFDNVKILEVNKKTRFLYIFLSIFSFFNKHTFKDILYSIKKRIFSIKKLLMQFKYHAVSRLLYHTLTKINEIKINPKEVTLLSVWFTSEALAISKLKKKYFGLKCVSMAHAHEIQTEKNDDTYFYKTFQHIFLDKIIFISQTKFNTYCKYVCEPLGIDTNNCVVIYWGSKRQASIGCLKDDEPPTKIIVSCSTVEPLKRVEQIAKAISLLGHEYVWHHFGDGRTFNDLLNVVDQFNNETKKRIFIHGRLENDLIKKFYLENHVDLFINFSTTEGLPISVMEALSFGIPCVVTDVGGEKEIIKNGLNGFVIDVNSSYTELADTIRQYFALPNAERKLFKKNSISVWETKFNLTNNIEIYYEVLK